MRKFMKKMLMTCIISLQIIKPVTTLYANTMVLTYDGMQHTYTKPPISLSIDGVDINMPIMPPVQIDGRTLVPTREVFEPMGAFVEWKSADKKVFINHGETLMIMEVDNDNVWIDGATVKLDVPAKIINDKLMLPLRFIGETLGYKVDWDHNTSSIKIKGNNTPDQDDDSKVNEPKEDAIQHKTQAESVEIESIDGMNTVYAINFTNSVDVYNTFKDKGKIVVDIESSKNLLQSNITLPNNNYVSQVRTSQYSPTTTRVVFDLKAAAESSVELSRNKKQILVTMKPMEIKNIKSGINQSGPFINFPGINKSQIEVSTLDNPSRIVIDLPMAQIPRNTDISNIEVGNVLLTRTSSDSDKSRIVLDLVVPSDYEIIDKNGEITVQLIEKKEMKTRNMKYESTPKEMVTIKKPAGLYVDSINVKDDYRNRKIILTLPGNYSDHFDQEILSIGSSAIDKVLIQNNNNTEIIVYENKVRAFDIIDDGENIKIVFMQPRDKYSKIVMLDIGHGGKDNGASANGLVEKNVNYQQGMALYRHLEADPNIKVYITREDDSYPTNPFRAELANEIGVDMFISLHNNSFAANAKGTEVLYSTSNGKSKQIATIIQNNMVNRLGTFNRGPKPRPDLIVLNSTKMPAVLVETAFLTNPEDAQKLASAEFNNKVGQVIYDSIVEIFNTISFR